jgi:phosphatidylinositol glycan class V
MYFTLAACFRSNGVLSGGFVIWGLVIRPHLELRQVSSASLDDVRIFTRSLQAPDLHRTAKAALLACTICLPSVIYQLIAYKVFCAGNRAPEFAWCRNAIPSIYGHVQSAYWNVGFLRYWTLSQLPNILLASPVLMLLFTFCARHMRTEIPRIAANLSQRDPAQHIKPLQSEPFLDPGITPHAIHAFIMCGVLLFASHTQIALRLAASMPLTYWAAAWLLVKHPALGRAWVGWSIVWGTISIVLWAAFLPPA